MTKQAKPPRFNHDEDSYTVWMGLLFMTFFALCVLLAFLATL